MPTAVTLPAASAPFSKGAQKPQAGQQARKKRVARRRGRGQNAMDSDDEIEREVASDSDFDHDDHSSSDDSATDDSDTEPASEDAPSQLQSPLPTAVVGVAGEGDANGATPFFASTSNWSEMVTDETVNGPSGLPVIDFAEFDGAAKPPARRSKKAPKQRKTQVASTPTETEPSPEEQAPAIHDEEHVSTPPPASAPLPRKLGQTARQAYQQRLETDPSYVPKVGGFWGHDDRLMDKDLRSLSNWWRGKWSGNGRARGRGFGMRGGARPPHAQHEVNPEDLPPVERTWGHDGFEEMKQKEERRQNVHPAVPRGGFRGGRGGFAGRGRGAFKNRWGSPAGKGKALAPVIRHYETVRSQPSAEALFFEEGGKIPKSGIQVKLPGKQEVATSLPLSEAFSDRPAPSLSTPETQTSKNNIIICLPKKAKPPTNKAEPLASIPATAEGPAVDENVYTQAADISSSMLLAPVHAPPTPEAVLSTQGFPDPSLISQFGQISVDPTRSDAERQAIEEAVLRHSGTTAEGSTEQRPDLNTPQAVFTPPPQPSPVYGSPYAFPQALPPGIALDHQGMPYEVATGRPVYLQPPPMYNPRPMHYPPPGVPYMHGHAHPIASPDYLAGPPSHTPPISGFIDPNTGAPIFSLPRPVQVEIRAPDDTRGSATSPPASGRLTKPPTHSRTPSKLRMNATAFEPEVSTGADSYPSLGPQSDAGSSQSHDNANGAMVHDGSQHAMHYYGGYQHPYYHPESYGYPGYMDMSQAGQYDPYMDHSQHQHGTVYY